MLTGPDVSNYQGSVDAGAVRRAGNDFMLGKATEGLDFVDRYYAMNRKRCADAGLTFGGYHFGHPGTDPEDQARHFSAVAGWRVGDIPLALDLEVNDHSTDAHVVAWTHAFVAELRRLHPNMGPPLFYTYPFFVIDAMGGTHEDFGCPLWFAWRGQGPADTPPGWDDTGWTFLQWTSTGRCPGINGPADMNRFAGDRSDLEALTHNRPRRASYFVMLAHVTSEKSAQQIVDAFPAWRAAGRPTLLGHATPEDHDFHAALVAAGFGPHNADKIVWVRRWLMNGSPV